MTAAVLDRIRAGEFRPGDRLPTEKGLMAEYGVGRNAAREAVQALVAMGLVDVRPGRGATVLAVEAGAMDSATVAALLQDHTVDHLYEFRRLLEVEIARRAAERASEDDIEELEDVLARFCRAYERGRRTDAIDDEFHAALAAASHNPVYSTVLDAVGDLISSARRLASSVPWAVERALTEHDELLAAVADHDPDAAADIMGRHIDGAIEAIREGRRAVAGPDGDAPPEDTTAVA
ncbi:MAG: FadR/GntR family transcriptional regulator [Solirubrobacteraceae bacterium]